MGHQYPSMIHDFRRALDKWISAIHCGPIKANDVAYNACLSMQKSKCQAKVEIAEWTEHTQTSRPTNRRTNNKTHTNNQTLPVETLQTSDYQRKNWRKTYAGGVGRASAAKANLPAKPTPAAECSWNIFGDLFAARSLWHVCRQQQQQQQQRGQRQRQSQRQ